MTLIPRFLAAPAVLFLLAALPASGSLLKYDGGGTVVGVFGDAPEFINGFDHPYTWLSFEMVFDPSEGPITSTSNTATYAALSGAVLADDVRLPLVSAWLEITRENFEHPSVAYSYVFLGLTAEGWILRHDSSASEAEFVPDLELPTDPAEHVDYYTTITLKEQNDEWSAFSDRTMLFSVETVPDGSHDIISDETWENIDIGSQDQAFTIRYQATPSNGQLDAVTGLSLGAADWWSDLAAIVRFAPSGVIDARNGGVYQAAQTLEYETGMRYDVVMEVDFASGRYSATVTPPDGAAVVIADDYAFRSEQSDASVLDTLSLFAMDGALAVSRVEVDGAGDPSPSPGFTSDETWENIGIGVQDQAFTITYLATPSVSQLDAVTGLAPGPADGWSDLGAIVRFAPSGFVDARNGSTYQAADTLTYQGGVDYEVTLSIDFEAKRYSATVTPPDGAPVVIADNYAFRSEHSDATYFSTLSFFAMDGTLTVALIEVSADEPSSPTIVSDGTWENLSLPSQNDFFSILYDVTPGASGIDAVTGLSLGPADWWSDLAAIIRFAPSGFIDARNGGSYQAANTMSYQAGVRYRVTMNVDVMNGVYNASVTPEGGEPVLIADDYAFRSEQSGILELDHLALHSMGGASTLGNVEIITPGPPE